MNSLDEISLELVHLKELIDLLKDTMMFQFTIFWAVIGVVITGLGISLVIMIRKWVEKRVDQEVIEFKKELKMFESHWIPCTLYAGWNSDDFETFSFKKDYFDFVHLRGVVCAGHPRSEMVTWLPVGYRPSQISTFGIIAGESPNLKTDTITIKPTGEVVLNVFSGKTVYLNGIYFHAEIKL